MTSTEPRFRHALPDLEDARLPGAVVTRHAVSSILLVMLLVGIVALLVMALVSVDITVNASGVLEPIEVSPVYAAEPGIVRTVLVSSGDTVRAGQALLALDSLGLANQLRQAELQRREALLRLRQAEAQAPSEVGRLDAQVEQARAAIVRVRATLRERMVAFGVGENVDSLLAVYRPGMHTSLDVAVSDVLSAEAQLRDRSAAAEIGRLGGFEIQRLQSEVNRLDEERRTILERFERLTLRAPTSGVVLTEELDRLAGSYIAEGAMVLEIAEPRAWRVILSVPPRDVDYIRTGDRVKVEVDAFRDAAATNISGAVSFIARQPRGEGEGRSAGAPLYRVEAILDQDQVRALGLERFRRGYAVRGAVVTRSGKILRLLWLKLRDALPRGSGLATAQRAP